MKIKSILWDIAWTILTLGLFNIWVQIRQIQDVNEMLGRDEYSFVKVVIFSLLTLGLYFVWHEYKLTKELYRLAHGAENREVALLCGLAAFFGLWFITDSYQQTLINSWISRQSSLGK